MENWLLLFFYGVFLLAVLGMGNLILRWLQFEVKNRVEALAFSLGFGAIFYSYLFHVLGIFHILYGNLLIALYFVPALFFAVRYARTVPIFLWKKLQLLPTQFQLLLPLAIAGFIFLPHLPYLFLYPAGWDVVAYHLPLPKFYLAMHYFGFARWFDQIGFPIGIESLYGFGEALHEPRLANFIHFTFILATTGYLFAGLKYFLSERARWMVTFLFLFQPMLYSEVALSAYVDYPFAFFTLLMSIALVRFTENKKPSSFIALGILALFLPLIKVSGLLVGAALSIVIGVFLVQHFWQARRSQQSQKNQQLRKSQKSPREKFASYFQKLTLKTWMLAASSAVFPIYWFVKTAYYTGNPFYPFYNSFFKGLGYDPNATKDVLKDDIFQNSFVKEMAKNFYHQRDVPQDYVNLFAVSFLAMGFIACLWLLRNKRKDLRIFAGFYLLLFLIAMVAIGPITRYVFFLFPAFGMLVGTVVFDWQESKEVTDIATSKKLLKKNAKKKKPFPFLKIFHTIFILLTVALMYIQIDGTFYQRAQIFLAVPKGTWLYFMDPTTEKNMLAKQDNYLIEMYANTHLDPKHDKVLQLLDNRIYYLDIPNAFANTIYGGYFTNPATRDVAEVATNIKKDGYTHVIKLNAWGAHPVMRQELFNGFMDQYTQPIATMSGVTLYKIK